MRLPVDPHLYAGYLAAMAVMAVTPGPANLFSIANGMSRGPRAVLLGVAGMNAATLTWYVAAAVGLAALVEAFPTAFKLLAAAGGVYVAWLGLKALIGASKLTALTDAASETPPLRRAFRDGFAVQIANPKMVLFFGAVLPPFLDTARPMAPQLGLFALATIGMDSLAMTAYGLGGARLSRRMAEPGFRRAFGVLQGVLLLAVSALILSRLL